MTVKTNDHIGITLLQSKDIEKIQLIKEQDRRLDEVIKLARKAAGRDVWKLTKKGEEKQVN